MKKPLNEGAMIKLELSDKTSAEKIMGWKYEDGDAFYADNSGHIKSVKWHPTTNIDQAFMVLEKCTPKWAIISGHGGITCDVFVETPQERNMLPGIKKISGARCESVSEAIIRACLKAKEIEIV